MIKLQKQPTSKHYMEYLDQVRNSPRVGSSREDSVSLLSENSMNSG
jgi:hypothetical protein